MHVDFDPNDLPQLPWIIVGYGRVGQALACLADNLDQSVVATWNRSRQASEASKISSPHPTFGPLPQALSHLFERPALVWLTVVDDAIEAVFDKICAQIPAGSVVVHTSGSLSSGLLSGRPDLHVASLHPLQAISNPQAAVKRFSRSFWSIEGDDKAVDYLCRLLAPAKIEPLRLRPENKILYHAAAVTAANLLVSLLDGAIAMAEAADIDGDRARQMLVELANSSLENLANRPPKYALTGPAARGDMTTIENHRQALAKLDDQSLLTIYELLTRRALDGLSD